MKLPSFGGWFKMFYSGWSAMEPELNQFSLTQVITSSRVGPVDLAKPGKTNQLI